MSFQRHKAKAGDWKAWLRRHRDALAACGLPEAILRDRLRWGRFLDHGYCQETGWRLAFLLGHAAGNLYRFLYADLAGADLAGADLRRADLTGANLRGVNLRAANIAGATFTEADLAGATMPDGTIRP